MNTILEQSLSLPIPERIKLVEDIWDTITESPDQVLLSEAQLTEIERRLDDHRKHPHRGIPWEQAREKLRKIA